MTTISTRPATEADTAFARSVHHEAYREVVERQFGGWDTAAQDRFFAADWQPAQMEVIVVDDVPCGYWAVEERAGDVHLRELVIHPNHQGRGIGSALLRRLQRRAADRGVPILLGTLLGNRAIALYERLGFQRTDRTETHVLMAWHPLPTEAGRARDQTRDA